MTKNTIYSDRLVSITENDITFFNYYYPTFKKKTVKFNDIEYIVIVEPTLRNGKWRLHGTGNFKVWFPDDGNRPKRDRIFIATLRNQWVDIGFTVEDGDAVEKILNSKILIKNDIHSSREG